MKENKGVTMALSLHKLTLSLFRNHGAARMDFTSGGQAARQVVLSGPNGAGKTNVLEAISLLAPGRGLRGADNREMIRRTRGAAITAGARALEGWAVAAEVLDGAGEKVRLGVGYDPRQDKRRLRVDGREAGSSAVLAGHFSVLWLTPQMDRLFVDGVGARRRFFDRMVAAYAPDHAARLHRLEKLHRERLALLQMRREEDRWLSPLENRIAEEAVAIAAARLNVAEKLQQQALFLGDMVPLFPLPRLSLRGFAEEALTARPALAVEADYAAMLAANRLADAAAGRTTAGAHRSDMDVVYAAKEMPAAQASTGEQKGLLVALLLAQVRMMAAEKGFAPVLLLDEIGAHFDAARLGQLFAALGHLGAQVFVTGTDKSALRGCAAEALWLAVEPLAEGDARLVVEAAPVTG